MTTESHIYLETMEAGSTVWSDYDGDTIYGDYEVVFTENPPESGIWSKQIVEKTAYLPGIAQMDSETGYVVYFHTDQIGTTRVITSSSLKRPHRYVSTAFGERVHTDGTVGTRYQYAGAYGYETLPAWSWDAMLEEYGYQDDENVPFLHVGYRYYNPETGRFLQHDPIGIDGGLNTYVYCEHNPLIYTDPSGLFTDTGFNVPEGWRPGGLIIAPTPPPGTPTGDGFPCPSDVGGPTVKDAAKGAAIVGLVSITAAPTPCLVKHGTGGFLTGVWGYDEVVDFTTFVLYYPCTVYDIVRQ